MLLLLLLNQTTRTLRLILPSSALKTTRLLSCLVIAEHNNHRLKSAARSAITAAKQLGNAAEIFVVVAGTNCEPAVATLSKTSGLKTILIAQDGAFKGFIAEPLTRLVLTLQKKHNFTHILAGSSTFSKNFLPRLAAKLDISPVSEVVAIKSPDTFQRMIYAGSAIQTITCPEKIKILLVRSTRFPADKLDGGSPPTEKIPDISPGDGKASFIRQVNTISDRPDLTSAKIVVSGGRGVGTKQNFTLVYQLADKLKAAVGASRGAVDAGFAPNDLQVGQSGKIVAPDLYIAAGISGATQHLSGMRDSKTIVAINSDPKAPIFQIATFGLVGDFTKIVSAAVIFPEINLAAFFARLFIFVRFSLAMATRDSFNEPFVLLSDVMDDGLKSVLVAAAGENNNNNNWLEVEQTEPLNLCLNTFAMVEYYPEFIDCGSKHHHQVEGGGGGGDEDADVIFVKEYQVRRENGAKKQQEAGGGRRAAASKMGAHPRRNPVRRTRTLQQRFTEYTDGSALDMADFIEANENDDEIVDYEDYSGKNNGEDVDDWNVQMCRTKPKRRILTSTTSRKTKFNRMDRRRKKLIDNNNEKDKEPIGSLQPILQSNLLLVKDYVKSVDSATRQKAINLFKQQAIFLAIAKNVSLENDTKLFELL